MWVRILFLCLWMISSSVLYSPYAKGVFGVKVSIAPNSKITTFVCYLYNGRVLTNQRVVDKDTFVKFVSGFWPSIYNPDRIDLFKEHEIDCSIIEEEVTHKKVVGCVPIDSLWKIRFATYPYRTLAEDGWSNKLHKPSPSQEQYLYNRYGVRSVDANFFLDTSFWMLMQDVTDPNWIANYKSLR